MPTLSDILLSEPNRPAVVEDLVTIVDSEVANTGGAAGLVIKPGYAMAKKSKPGFIARQINDALPAIVDALEPHYAEALASGQTVSASFQANSKAIAADIATAAESYVENSGRDGMRKGYKRFGGQAPKQIASALPKIAKLIEKYQAA